VRRRFARFITDARAGLRTLGELKMGYFVVIIATLLMLVVPTLWPTTPTPKLPAPQAIARNRDRSGVPLIPEGPHELVRPEIGRAPGITQREALTSPPQNQLGMSEEERLDYRQKIQDIKTLKRRNSPQATYLILELAETSANPSIKFFAFQQIEKIFAQKQAPQEPADLSFESGLEASSGFEPSQNSDQIGEWVIVASQIRERLQTDAQDEELLPHIRLQIGKTLQAMERSTATRDELPNLKQNPAI